MKKTHNYMIHNGIVHNGGGKRNGSFGDVFRTMAYESLNLLNKKRSW